MTFEMISKLISNVLIICATIDIYSVINILPKLNIPSLPKLRDIFCV